MHSVTNIQAILAVSAVIALVYSLARRVWGKHDTRNWPVAFGILLVALIEITELLSLTHFPYNKLWLQLSYGLLNLMPAVWLWTTRSYCRTVEMKRNSSFQNLLLAGSLLLGVCGGARALDTVMYAPDFPGEQILFLKTPGMLVYLGVTFFLLFSLVNLELVLVNASAGKNGRVKYDALGLGVIVAAYMLYASQGFLFRTIDMRFTIARSLFLVVAVVLMNVARTYHDRPLRLRISRQMAYKSAVLAAVGCYFIVVGLLGEGFRYLGVPFHKVLILFISCAVAILFIILFLSGRFRREIVVFINKHFYASKYDYRTPWLEFTQRLATAQSGEEMQRTILLAYCEIFGIDGAALFLYDHERRHYYCTACHEMEQVSDLFASDSQLVAYLQAKGWVLNLDDPNPEIFAEHGDFFAKSRAQLIVPLMVNEAVDGFIVLGKPIKLQEKYNYEDFDLMKTIARQASVSIVKQRLSEQVARLREMEVIGNISTFVIHDLKNHVAALSLLVDNARSYLDNPEFQQDMLRSLDNTVAKMHGLIGRLKNLGEKELLNLREVELLSLVQQTLPLVSGANVTVSGEQVLVRGDADELQKVILNLIINAVEASSQQMAILIETVRLPQPHVRIKDEGCGMTSEFQQRELFKPFVTTKKKGLGIGLYQCRRIIEAHGGRIDVSSAVGQGSVFTVWLPQVE